MKIAMVSPYDMGAFGGVQNQVIQLTEALIRRGHDVTIVGPGQLPVALRFVSLGPARVVRANDSSAPISLRPRVVGMMRRVVAGVDVVHVHEPLVPLVGLAARWTGRPLVGTFHADPGDMVRSLYRWFLPLRWHLRRFSALCAVSETARSAVETLGAVTVVPNGIRTTGLPSASRVPGRIVFVGRNDPRKGLDVALAAFAEIHRVLPTAELVVVTPDEVRPRPGVTVRRAITDAEKLELLATAEVFVAPNRRGESFGLTVAEAMAAGCAVVASDLPAFRDVMGGAGVYVEPDDPDGLSTAIARLLDDGSRLRRIGDALRSRAQEFGIDAVADRYSGLYEEAARR